MSIPVARLGDSTSGHDCFPPQTIISSATTVLAEGIPIARLGDAVSVHCCPNNGCHSSIISLGSTTVIVEGSLTARIGDSIACGGVITTGATSVLAG